MILQAMRKIEADTRVNEKDCITFKPRANESVYLKLFPGSGCWSNVSEFICRFYISEFSLNSIFV
mgnify:CR=1 FL=1